MASEIIVFQPPEKEEIFLTKSERELLYEDFEKYSSLDSHHFAAFYDLETEDVESIIIDSTVVSIMFKYIIDYGFPIIGSIPTLDLKKRKSIKKNGTEKESISNEYYFTSQFSNPVRGYTRNGNTIMLAHNVYYKIIGFLLPKKILKLKDFSIPDMGSEINILNLTTMGHYGLKSKLGGFTQQRSHFLHINACGEECGKKIIFESKQHALDVINKIINYVRTNDAYYNLYYNSLYVSLKFSPFSTFRDMVFSKLIKSNKWDLTCMETMKDTEEINTVRKIYEGILSNYPSRFYHDLINAKLSDVYYKIWLLGVGHSKSKDILNNQIILNKNEKNLKFQKKQKYEAYLVFAKKKAISLEKFNINDLNKLDKSQREIVELQYKSVDMFETSVKSESSDLVDYLQEKIEVFDYLQIKKTIEKLKKFITVEEVEKLVEKKELIKDSQGKSIICPHIFIKAEKLVEAEKNTDKLDKIREYINTRFAIPDTMLGYYCKVCGALLAENDDEEIIQFLNNKQINTIEFDQTQSLIWKEVAHIVTTFVKFKSAVNLKKIITSITQAIRLEIGVIETKLTKVKTNNNDNIRELLRIYITVYAYAVLIHMIYLNYGKITFINRDSYSGGDSQINVLGIDDCSSDEESPYIKKTGGKTALKSEDKKHLQNIFKTAIEIIIKSKNSLLNSLANISADSIKPLLINAYQWVVHLKTDMKISDTIRRYNTAQFLTIDPFYEYIWYAHSLKSYSEKSGELNINDITRYLGRPLEKIEEEYSIGLSIYETAKSVEPWGKSKKQKLDYGSFMSVFTYIKNKIYNSDVIPLSNSLSDFYKTYGYLKELSYSIEMETALSNLKPMVEYKMEYSTYKFNEFSPDKINIAEHYCSDGYPHKFNIFVYNKALASGVLDTKKKLEITVKDVQGWISKDMKKLDEFNSYYMVDEKCSKCNSYLSSPSKTKDINKKLEVLNEIQAFYDYYENRCPEGNLHDYKIDTNKNIENCSKCNFSQNIMSSLDVKYMKKYTKNYNLLLAERKTIDKESLSEFKVISKKFTINIKKYPEWVVNNAPILQLSRTTGVKYNILINLGLSEGRKFENIEKEKENPNITSTVEEDILRIQYLRDYCLWMLRLYYITKNYNMIYNVPPDIKEIIHNNIKTGITEFQGILPEIYLEFNEKYEYYNRKLSPKFLANFLLNYLCGSLNKIKETLEHTRIESLGNDFVKYCITSIVTSERDVSKPPPLSLIVQKEEESFSDAESLNDFPDVSDDDEVKSTAESDENDDFYRGDLDLDHEMEDNMNTNYTNQ